MSNKYAYFPKALTLAEIQIALKAIYLLITNNNTVIETKVEEAPEDGFIYGREDGEWVRIYDPSNVVIKSNDYTIIESDHSVVIDASSNTVTITMPADPGGGVIYNVACQEDTFTADINWNGKLFYDEAANLQLYKGENLTMQYDGIKWIGA